MNAAQILILPGWQNSGPTHWQSLWQQKFGYTWVEQHDWMRPLRGDWVARLEDVVLSVDAPVVLVAHSLGCQLVAAWAAHSRHSTRVKAALLVAPGDAQREELRSMLASWSPPVLQSLPFRSCLVASTNDPYCSFERACEFANAWGAELVNLGALGHINADSGLGDWPQGQALLQALITL
ncbi:MAG: alpha/beta hydrolase [Rhodoferax sp.]|jgi:predicted alpha/beta hydrolase family esterase|uniref:RBBP9/YdeN family alpha/beta hydrolase n=1 Tax=Rhodoferax sp. TaxID=50421 RepID=UPI001B7280C3|nr:alpha/beta fold hydrolase [Rhodoferax sp.]MBP8288075.1 alpha/beta hydrolase [Rhodoferax sp.]MBP9148688.1 alpha/beta hydrolase [Rhodoferax sp.]MBP9736502.1 alpha/beta hydrolase [Rhodoferax sp.]